MISVVKTLRIIGVLTADIFYTFIVINPVNLHFVAYYIKILYSTIFYKRIAML